MRVGGIVVVVIAAVVGVSDRDSVQPRRGTHGPVLAPAGRHRRRRRAPRPRIRPRSSVVVYEDFQCPVCKAFEDNVGSTLDVIRRQGTVQLEYRPIAFLDQASTTKYSSRALATAAAHSTTAVPPSSLELHDLLFANQPAEGSAGLDRRDLGRLAGQAGADKAAVAACQSKGTYDAWVADVTDQASQDGINGTPTYFVDGKQGHLHPGRGAEGHADAADRRQRPLSTAGGHAASRPNGDRGGPGWVSLPRRNARSEEKRARWSYRDEVEFCVLGPLLVIGDARADRDPRRKERTLLAILVSRAGQVVARRLVDTLWGEDPPRTAAKSLQTHVLRLRNMLEPQRMGCRG